MQNVKKEREKNDIKNEKTRVKVKIGKSRRISEEPMNQNKDLRSEIVKN